MEKINAVDRVPTQVLQNGARRYGIYNSSGVLQEYVYIKKEDEPSVAGTDVNKILFDKIDTNMEEIDGKANMGSKYVSATLTNTTTDLIQENIVPTEDWEEITTGIEYTNYDYNITIRADSYNGSSNKADSAVDGADSTRWLSASGSSEHYFIVDFGHKEKITKVRGKFQSGSTSSGRPIKIQGSNDGTSWTDLFTQTTNDSNFATKTLTTTGYYQYYRVYYYYNSSNAYLTIFGFEVAEYEQVSQYFTMDLGITAYELGQRVLMKAPSGTLSYGAKFININSLGNKRLTGILTANSYHELVMYNTMSFGVLR